MRESPAEKPLRRVLLISAIDGWSIAVFAGVCTLVSLVFAEWIGVGIGAIVTAAGVLELRGRTRLLHGDVHGLNHLMLSQLIILVTISAYALRNLLVFNEAEILGAITPDVRNFIGRMGVSMDSLEQVLKPAYFATYLTVIGLTLLFQGGMALFYRSQRVHITKAFAAARPPEPPPLPHV